MKAMQALVLTATVLGLSGVGCGLGSKSMGEQTASVKQEVASAPKNVMPEGDRYRGDPGVAQ